MDRRNLSRIYEEHSEIPNGTILAELIAKESYDFVMRTIRENNISDREIVRTIDLGSRLDPKTGTMLSWLNLLDMQGLLPREGKRK